MMDEGMKLRAALTLVLAKLNGEVKVVHKDNIIVNGGFDFVADAIGNSGSRPGVMGWIAVGTGAPQRRSFNPNGTGHRIKRNACHLCPYGWDKGLHFHGQLCSRRCHRCIDRSGVFNAASGGLHV
jgi:hypothetical protein